MTKQTSEACPVCGSDFTAVRTGHKYCSAHCRVSAHRARIAEKAALKRNKRISDKLKKLGTSSFGKYLVKEIKRAGSVEVLRGHTQDSLKELVALRRRCNRYSGYEDGKALGTYELSHIYASRGKEGFGRLHPINLVIAPKQFNRKLGAASDSDFHDLYMDYGLAERCWVLSEKDTTAEKILRKARRYLGKEFDDWLSSFSITQSQRQAIIKSLVKSGVKEAVLDGYSLEALRDLADEREVPYFVPNHGAEAEVCVLAEELERLYPSSPLLNALKWMDPQFSNEERKFKSLKPRNYEVAKAFVTHAGWLQLHRFDYLRELNGVDVTDFFHEWTPEVIAQL